MNEEMKRYFEELESKDKTSQYEAYQHIMAETEQEVDWAYEVWDDLKADLTHKDAHRRSRAAQFLAQLAISDPENRMLHDFPDVWEVTFDSKFVTARHSLQAIWRVGLAGPEHKQLVMDHLTNRFENCQDEKNYTLIRFDIMEGMRSLYDYLEDPEIKRTALDLIEKEQDAKYRKKYASVW
ncbi:hypothetical protein [Thalassobacillus hwangdonensis]|uniref:HEAT repeat domain-containing protein n=1 Tax=Thalassobacillus hwangdonensis TaxID=546108 RepID=A0ABW3L4J5_9BACI